MASGNVHNRREIDQEDLYLGCVLRLRRKANLETLVDCKEYCRESVERGAKECSKIDRGTLGHPVVVLKVKKNGEEIKNWIVTIATFCSLDKTTLEEYYAKRERQPKHRHRSDSSGEPVEDRGPFNHPDIFLHSSMPVHQEHRLEQPELYLVNGRRFRQQSYFCYLHKYYVPVSFLETFEGMRLDELEWYEYITNDGESFFSLTDDEQDSSQSSQVTLRLNWPSYKLAMDLFREPDVLRHRYERSTQRHGSALVPVYLDWLRQQFRTPSTLLNNTQWLRDNGFL